MPDILDDLRAELDSAFARAEDAPSVQPRGHSWSGRVRHRWLGVPRDRIRPCAFVSCRPPTDRTSAHLARIAGRGA